MFRKNVAYKVFLNQINKTEEKMKELTLQQKIGQRMIVGFAGTEIDDVFENLVKEYKVANVILFKHNIVSAPQLKKLCADIQKLVKEQTGHFAFITIDQEGGVVTRLSADCTNVPGAMAIAATQNPKNAYTAGLITANELRALGVNFNLAPDVDVNNNPKNPVIGVRSYGDTPQRVVEYSLEMIKGLTDGKVVSCVKHFPGHGDTDVDSHLGLPQIDKTYEQLDAMEFVPFKAAIKAGVPSVMTTHILFPQLEKENLPATMSRTIMTDILRGKMGFKGLIISDCMEMDAIKVFYGTAKGIVAAFKAGVDMVFCSHTAKYAIEAMNITKQQIETGEIDMREMDESVERILTLKEQYADCENQDISIVNCAEHKAKVKQIMRDSITIVGAKPPFTLGNSPCFIGCYPFRATNASNTENKVFSFSEYMCDKLGGSYLITATNPEKSEIARAIESATGASSIVVGTYQGHLQQGQIALVDELAKQGVPIACVALRNPYDLANLPNNVLKIAAYEYTEKCLDEVAEVLSGTLIAKGVLSVAL